MNVEQGVLISEFEFGDDLFSDWSPRNDVTRLTREENKVNFPREKIQRENGSCRRVQSIQPSDVVIPHNALPKVTRDKRKANAVRSLKADIHICIDLALSDQNSERENKSLAIQIRHSYGAIRKSAVPVALHLTSYASDGCIATNIAKQKSDSWCIHRHSEPVEDVFELCDMVVLSPDAEDVLDEVPGKVYVIGGIVDKNIKKQITLGKALEYQVSKEEGGRRGGGCLILLAWTCFRLRPLTIVHTDTRLSPACTGVVSLLSEHRPQRG